MLLPMVI